MSHAKLPRRLRPRRRTLPQLGDRYGLGAAKLQVSPFCLGMVGSPDTVLAAYDAGINFFFITADMHWPWYEATRTGLARLLLRGGGIRDRIVVGVVSYCTQPEFCYAPFAEALDAVPGLTRIDLPIAGGAYGGEFKARTPIYRQHRASGYLGAKAIGASFHDRSAALAAVNAGTVDIAYVRYNPAHPGARKDLFPNLDRKSATLLYNFKNTMGAVPRQLLPALGIDDTYWKPKVSDYYRFVLARPELHGSLVSLASPEEVTALAAAMREGPLSLAEEEYLMDLAILSGSTGSMK